MIRIAPRRCGRMALVVLALVASGVPTFAQVLIDKSIQDPTRRGRPATNANLSPRSAAPWPRLDAGALVCRSREDLEMHSRAVEARLDGSAAATTRNGDCKLVGAMTPIDIVARPSPSATEIRMKGETQTAWTDTWLPARPPQ